jgi:uncharacterized protein involved in exopolysaccharide biosynthesis
MRKSMNEEINKYLTSTERTSRDEIDILSLIVIIWKERRKIIYVTGGMLLLSFLYIIIVPNWYRASVKIMPTNTIKSSLLNQLIGLSAIDISLISKSPEDHQLLYPDIVISDFILDRVLEHRFKLDQIQSKTLFEFWNIDIDSSQQDWKHQLFEESKKTLREEYIEVEVNNETGLITIDLTVPRYPVLAAEMANYVTNLLDIYNKQFRKYKATDQRVYIDKSIKETKSNLELAEEALKIFSEQNRDLNSPEKQLQYDRLETEVEVQKSIYTELRKQLELAKIEEIKETETLDILQYAVPPIEKYRPKKLLIIIISLFGGIFISIIFIFSERIWHENREAFKNRCNKV